ncbi:MAG: hypothetical protein EAZ08_03340 [Cytophagales bacterium]|nr:MAG: hypothetical protein EAZ08_03340 [Cytophagales bacterium]
MKKHIFIHIALVSIALSLFTSCTSTKDYNSLKSKVAAEADKNQKLLAENQKLKKTVSEQENGVAFMKSENIVLKDELKKLKADLENAQRRLDEKLQGAIQQKEAQWQEAKYQVAKTAAKESYLSREEQNVFYYLNLARMNPPLFAETFLDKFMQENEYHNNPSTRSLFNELMNLQPLSLVKPSKKMFDLALCHSTESGKTGYTGHERVKRCEKGYKAECCYYGDDAYSGLKIVLQLLIDEDIKTLDNRKVCLGEYAELGVSIQLHKTNSYGAVLDFQ